MAPTEEEDLRERIRLSAASLKEQGLLTQDDLVGAGLLPVPGNANPYVPWSDPQIPYACACGQIIYADTPHSHGEETDFAESEYRRVDETAEALRSRLNIDEVVERALALFNEHEVKHYYQDRGEEYRSGGRAYEAGDAVRSAMERLGGVTNHQSEYDEVAPKWWPEAEQRVCAAIPDYSAEIDRRQQLGYEPQ